MSSHMTGPGGNTDWRISRTCDSGACVGVARRGEMILLANTNSLDAPIAQFTTDEWRQFLAGVRLGDFDEFAEDL
jgi:predicted secreted Zn-dependent protease